MKKTNNKIATSISNMFIFLLVVLVIGFLLFKTDNFTTDIKEFYVSCNGREIMGDYTGFDVQIGKEYKFNIVNNKDNILDSKSNYTVKIVPNVTSSTTFAFKVDNLDKKYKDVTSLTNGFTITSYDKYFTLKANNDLLVMLQDLYSTENILDCPTTIDTGIDYYKLVITSDSGDVINITFNLVGAS